MSEHATYEAVERKAHELFGAEYARHWLFKPNRTFAQLPPYEMAQSEVGARLVLRELERTILIE
ncbi:hypothetical protein GCM10011611_07400 [Aliidongia dinghuensis]|uniref:Antitoxin Xre/MbcA/ParS-like toxin-binding domain-containing protein n=1 Tax=Aliidongia dinghuensis TaxID=1867774 RepID=A0A8J2YQ72_9PROT|nr:MbcA/ParS/Xre antitoxin family protein [Aliidongia dinghuensis]GGF04506.1 hypothetical protein GCM10011611_07400 [Aliidongia dinghuensis]